MADFMTPAQRSAHMAKIRSKDTKPEIKLRRFLHGAGYRYRLHDRRLPGRPDLVFSGRKKAIFVHGCFWHGHTCRIGARLPKTNVEFWADKRRANQERDRRQQVELEDRGWKVFVIWECEIESAWDDSIAKLVLFLDSP
ncbi:DNA mismatch endonuclease Vsr [Arthrobacter sp. RT-1]|uniref:very short patch repair endonuclease n=1 Tax=Arthrobacter sp. RT-1 TaxID=2292263 RepID=UPI000E1EC512|nr:very short patch repair endonuclease [Arthrobacter sp. RT-1]RDV08695.1 DNA mismatch endonuclease Vsr [Arthrobacter sp. RT-1]